MNVILALFAPAFAAPPTVSPLHGWTLPELASVGRLAVDSSGNVYVSDPARGVVVVRAPDGRVLRSAADLGIIGALAIDSAGNLLVADERLGQVTAYRSDWSVAYVLGGGPAEFSQPSDIDVDRSTGRIYVVDSVLGEVHSYDATGTLIATFDGVGPDPDTLLAYPTALAFAASTSQLFVVSQLTRKIVVFDADGAPLRAFGVHGERDGELYLPIGLAVDPSQRLWVADSRLARVTILDDQGALLGVVGSHGRRLGEFRQPNDIAFDGNGRAFVSDSNNGRVQVLGVDTFVDPERYVAAEARFAPPSIPRVEEPGFAGVILSVAGFAGDDIADVTAAGVPSLDHRGGDFDGDQRPDAYVRFDRAALLAALPVNGLVPVHLSGHTTRGEAFEAEAEVDIVDVQPPSDTDTPLDTGGPGDSSSSTASATRPADAVPPEAPRDGRCGCASGAPRGAFLMGPLALLFARRRR